MNGILSPLIKDLTDTVDVFKASLTGHQYNGDNYEIMFIHAIQKRSIDIVMDSCYNENQTIQIINPP